MSGIYIPGISMPKNCPCELLGIGYDLCCSFACGIPARVKEYYECCQNNKRPSWCPIVPVPDHGDLIDKGALTHLMGMDEHFSPLEAIYLMGLISDAPTIIEAEPSEEG